MSTIKIELDTNDTARIFDIAQAIEGLLSVIPEQSVVISYQEVAIVAPPAPEIKNQIVEVRGQYTYIADPSVLGRAVKVGDIVDVESKNGGHWNGKVSFVFEWDDYMDDHDEPTLYVREIL